MKEIKLKQHVEIVREVTMLVPDDCDEATAAKQLASMPINIRDASYAMPRNTKVEPRWAYVTHHGIKNTNGMTLVD